MPKEFTWINVVGTKFRSDDAQDKLAAIKIPVAATFRREEDNRFDSNAVAVIVDGVHAGYVARDLAVEFWRWWGANPGAKATAEVTVKDGMPSVKITFDKAQEDLFNPPEDDQVIADTFGFSIAIPFKWLNK